MYMPEMQPDTIRAVPAVEASVAVDTMASTINCAASSTSLERPAVTPMLIGHPRLAGTFAPELSFRINPSVRPPVQFSSRKRCSDGHEVPARQRHPP